MRIIEQDKLLAFEYVLFKLVDWYRIKNSLSNFEDFNNNNNLNKLKVIKLHFFLVAINSEKNTLLDVFNKFYAMPYGHVEGEIYNSLSRMSLFEVDNKKLLIKNTDNLSINDFSALEEIYINDVNESIEELKVKNPNIINYNALDLVELSHTWFSWKSMYSYAQSNHRRSELIPQQLIKEENKNYELIF
jgi:hypothetical protein